MKRKFLRYISAALILLQVYKLNISFFVYLVLLSVYKLNACISYKKLRNWASTESFLKSSDFEYSDFLPSSFKVSQQSSCSLPVPS